jgi:hypothetical protein
MTCDPLPGGGFFCNRGQRRPRCGVPGCGRRCEFECDFPIPRKKSGTCDAKLCGAHATRSGAEKDLCPPHAKAEAARG